MLQLRYLTVLTSSYIPLSPPSFHLSSASSLASYLEQVLPNVLVPYPGFGRDILVQMVESQMFYNYKLPNHINTKVSYFTNSTKVR